MPIDSICGMKVNEASALNVERDGRRFFFCGEPCRRKFLAKAAPASPGKKPPGKTVYTCSMHPEVRQDRPGDCPKCGIALELKTAAGLLYPFFGLFLSPVIAGAAMTLSSVSVIGNALRLRKVRL